MSPPFQNILLIGATGSVGSPILTALLSTPQFKTTILTRASSTATFPPGIPTITISDDYTLSELTSAFKGQDAVINAMSTVPTTKDDLAFRIVDAALAAGVKRVVPSEFGANNLDPRAVALVPVYARKGEMLRYLMEVAEKSKGALTWTSVACGAWLDWGLDARKSGNFLGVDVKGRKAVIWDSGRARFACTTSKSTGEAVVKILLAGEKTANKQVFLADFTSSVREVVECLEGVTGEMWEVEVKESGGAIRELKKRFEEGEFAATFGLLSISFAGDVDVGYDFEKEQKVWSEELGVSKQTLEEVVRGALKVASAAA